MTKSVKFIINSMFGVAESNHDVTFLAGGKDMVYNAIKVSLPDDQDKYRFIITSPLKELDVTIPKHQVTIL
jgi:hypothetical protein